ncbi:MAG: ferredoxin [Deltaproteobacteria bacterium]|nr:ferredoxin [Deltaproteobacteria bacterium]
MHMIPVINIGICTDCGSCMEVCPTVFKLNNETGQIEVIDLPKYTEDDVREAISVCPANCIAWEKTP